MVSEGVWYHLWKFLGLFFPLKTYYSGFWSLYMHGVRVGLMPYMSRLICHTLLLRAGVAAAPSTAAQNHPVCERDAAREPHRRHAGNTSEKAHILKSLFDSGVIYRKCTRALTFQNALETPLNFKSPSAWWKRRCGAIPVLLHINLSAYIRRKGEDLCVAPVACTRVPTRSDLGTRGYHPCLLL